MGAPMRASQSQLAALIAWADDFYPDRLQGPPGWLPDVWLADDDVVELFGWVTHRRQHCALVDKLEFRGEVAKQAMRACWRRIGW